MESWPLLAREVVPAGLNADPTWVGLHLCPQFPHLQ
jgi:hypothetical protein